MRGSLGANPKRLKRVLLLLTTVAIGIVIAVFILHRSERKVGGQRKAEAPAGASLSIDRVNQTATKDGVKQWSLTAANARYFQGEKKAVFTDLAVTFFLKEGKTALLEAREGVLNTATNDMIAKGSVVVSRDGYEITTEKLQYRHNQRIFLSNVAVTVKGDAMEISADGMTYNLDSNRTRMDGNVKGTFNERLDL